MLVELKKVLPGAERLVLWAAVKVLKKVKSQTKKW